jgi:prolyl-tRNA synthetase
MARRVPGGKAPVSFDALVDTVLAALEEDQATLLRESAERREVNTKDVETIEEAIAASATGWARIPWASLGEAGEKQLAQHAVTVRCLVRPDGGLPQSDDEPGALAVVGRSY